MNWHDFTADDEDARWIENGNGNHVLIVDGALAATVYRKHESHAWAIIINRHGQGHFVANEGFQHVGDARARAFAIVNGAPARLEIILPRGQRVRRRAP